MENDGMPAILTTDHFRSVAEMTTEFEAHLKSTKKGDETYQARIRQDPQYFFPGGGGR